MAYSYSSLTGFDSTVDASVTGAAIAALDNGFDSTTQEVLDAARDAASPLHGVFTWPGESSDAHTGEEDRLERAALLLRSVVVS